MGGGWREDEAKGAVRLDKGGDYAPADERDLLYRPVHKQKESPGKEVEVYSSTKGEIGVYGYGLDDFTIAFTLIYRGS